jgi:hypothetical protein
MPWAKPKAAGAYLAIYWSLAQRFDAQAYAEVVATPWEPVLDDGTVLGAEKVARQGRVWAKLPEVAKAFPRLAAHGKMQFRIRGTTVEVRFAPTPGRTLGDQEFEAGAREVIGLARGRLV